MPDTKTQSASSTQPTPPSAPTFALEKLVNAVIVLHLSTDMPDPTVPATIKACSILLYGLGAWQKADKKMRNELLMLEQNVEEVEMEALDRGERFSELEVYGLPDRYTKRAAREVVKEALEEISEWHQETGDRMFCALKEALRNPEDASQKLAKSCRVM